MLVHPSMIALGPLLWWITFSAYSLGASENICELRRHYGMSWATEAMVVVEAYRVLRD